MFETSDKIAPVELRQREFLPDSVNPSKGIHNRLEFHDLPKKSFIRETNGLMGKTLPDHQTPLVPPNENIKERGSELRFSATELPFYPKEKRFIIFDRCGGETRLMFSSLPLMQNLTTAQVFDANRLTAANWQTNKAEQQVWIKAPVIHDDTEGENEVVEEGSEMREDTEEINALLYSDDDYDSDSDSKASTGRSPLPKEGYCEVTDFGDVTSKRQKTMSRENVSYEDIICGVDGELGPTNGRKRPRTEKISHTLKVLEGIIPGVKSKNPVAILDEAISYLKCLKHNAQVMSMEGRLQVQTHHR